MVAKFGNFVARGVVLAAIGTSSLTLMSSIAAADVSVPCTGDATACKLLHMDQRGTDYQSGAHFVLNFTLPAGQPRQSMVVTLSIAPGKNECSKARDTLANVEPSAARSIDGYLCKLRATWQRI
jgi:hypothetical protein